MKVWMRLKNAHKVKNKKMNLGMHVVEFEWKQFDVEKKDQPLLKSEQADEWVEISKSTPKNVDEPVRTEPLPEKPEEPVEAPAEEPAEGDDKEPDDEVIEQ